MCCHEGCWQLLCFVCMPSHPKEHHREYELLKHKEYVLTLLRKNLVKRRDTLQSERQAWDAACNDIHNALTKLATRADEQLSGYEAVLNDPDFAAATAASPTMLLRYRRILTEPPALSLPLLTEFQRKLLD